VTSIAFRQMATFRDESLPAPALVELGQEVAGSPTWRATAPQRLPAGAHLIPAASFLAARHRVSALQHRIQLESESIARIP